MHIATISSQRQITLPKKLLDQLGLSVKDKVKVEVDNKKLIIEPISMKVSDLAGSLTQLIAPAKRGVPVERAKQIALDEMAKEWANE